MKKGQVYTGIVERVEFPNKGIVRAGEETCVVKNSLPGQKVSFLVNKVRHGKAEARLLEVIELSPLESGNPCSHFGLCGGCTYLSLPYEEQLRIKERQVRELLERALEGQEESWQWEGIKGSPRPYVYRNKMEFSFGDEVKDGPLSLGMHRRGSMYDVVHVSDCRIVDEDYRRILKAVLAYFQERGISFHHKMRHEGFLRHLLVRKAARTGEILVALVTSSQAPQGGAYGQPGDREEIQALVEGFQRCLLEVQERGELSGVLAGILHITNDSLADVVQSDRTDILYGRDYIYEELLGLRFKISTFSFFQTNTYSAEVLYETAREYVGELDRGRLLYDLYSGTGTIAQLMAAAADRVIGVEIVEEAVEAARENAALNGLENCEFIAGDVLKVLDGLTEKPDMIILDPPRDGIHPKALPKIIGYGVERIVYISCKPTSLARDLEAFLAGGYHVERAVAVDQFPWTANVETVCLLSKL
ncbi:MAG: 23S rRNA (uracil(1939)-C(5))-methyltransferase RlmD [Lachnospiraceae bacterium]|nr:23S rRNA (uracil(1939)-C(5))-methyltransferase RlmD [Lachnospiraceae bacterium]